MASVGFVLALSLTQIVGDTTNFRRWNQGQCRFCGNVATCGDVEVKIPAARKRSERDARAEGAEKGREKTEATDGHRLAQIPFKTAFHQTGGIKNSATRRDWV